MKNILVVIDVQNDFVYGKFSNKQAQNIVNPIFHEIIHNTVPYDKIIFTKDTHEYCEFDGINTPNLNTYEGRKFSQHCIDPADQDIVYPLSKAIGLPHVSVGLKNQFNGAWRVMDMLKEEFPTEKEGFNIYLCGVCTDICVLATAIGLTKEKKVWNIIVRSDLCAGTSPKAHKTALAAMKPFNIKIKNRK